MEPVIGQEPWLPGFDVPDRPAEITELGSCLRRVNEHPEQRKEILDLFYRPGTHGKAGARIETVPFAEAKAICALCPVREACLRYAMECEEGAGLQGRYGVFGGLSPEERHKLAGGSAPKAATSKLLEPIRCARESCGNEFVRDYWQQRCCSVECSRAEEREAAIRRNVKRRERLKAEEA